ncbi:phosphotransferase family protein [Seohaeicola zhoushanensis]|uniref:Aminoglycoside phosphotransferase n=1 Tax=Seohaeicola zhoushanensis TaxID=1569283 RepID=A0A8J3H033_9RHOB|nr:phosphotransferase family protein [Seohaeicola zhoushanensis]GHF64895.1 aminoglycoside phosphotransferase [Seohaeicola zhoushanensis]
MSAADLDLGALERWLTGKLPGESGLSVQRISGGQSNPTWFVDFGAARLVLRKKPAGPVLKGAHAIEREFRVLRALADSEVPVPEALWLEEDTAVLGTAFYVMRRLEGRVFADCTLPGMAPDERRAIYLEMARVLARLHAVRPGDVGLEDFGRPGNYFERQLARWSRQYHESTGPRVPVLDRLLPWLEANLPPDDGAVSIVHGDFRLGNLMFHPTERRVVGVLDWELSTLGHPLADLGYCVMPWRSGPEEYGGILGTDWRAGGIPTEDDFVAAYHAAALPTPPLTPFHVAFAMFRFSVIFVGIADRARAGSAASAEADTLGPLAERFAIRALEAIEG